jgi:hypothetical protein
MEVTRQLLTECAGKTGLCRIQLTFCWEGQRLRLSSGQKCLNTFGKHVRALKTFLGWCEENDIEVNARFHKFQAPDEATGTDALTQAELLAIAGLDVYSEAGRALVRRHLVALIEKYRALQLPTCLPVGLHLDAYLPLVAELAGLTRIPLTSKVGRKTFVTLKLAQGVPRTTVMQATGHKTEKSFNRYAGIDEQELVESYRKTARRVPGQAPGSAAA